MLHGKQLFSSLKSLILSFGQFSNTFCFKSKFVMLRFASQLVDWFTSFNLLNKTFLCEKMNEKNTSRKKAAKKKVGMHCCILVLWCRILDQLDFAVGVATQHSGSIMYLVVFFHLCVVNVPNLAQLAFIVRVLQWAVRWHPARAGRGRDRGGGSAPLLWTGHTFGQQHVVQSHKLWVWKVLLLSISYGKTCK